MPRSSTAAALAALLLGPTAGFAQPAPPARAGAAATAPVALTLAEALELALVRSYSLALSKLEYEESQAQIEQAWGSVYPRVDLSAGYTRTLRAANPFAGSSAGNVFGGLDAIGWLAFNESARTQGGEPITLAEYQQRSLAGQRAAGLEPADPNANPFLVENTVDLGLNISQTLYNGAAFAAIRGAEAYEAQVEAGLRAGQLATAQQVCTAFHGALLAQAQVRVLEKSVARTRETVTEITERVAQGVLPRFQQLSAEVELNNLETSLIQARAGHATAVDGLKVAVGLSPSQPLEVSGELTLGELTRGERTPPLDFDRAYETAVAERPDLEQVRKSRHMLEVQAELTDARTLPIVSAFANVGLRGTIPDDRTVGAADPMVPFGYTKTDKGVFDGDYWNDTVVVGLKLTWNLFDGFQTTQQQQLDGLALKRIDVRLRQSLDAVQLELRTALRDLRTADERLRTLDRNIERAQLNYDHAKARVAEGVSTQIELREANQQLDQSQLGRLQAVHDYLNAAVRYRIAIGQPPVPGSEP